MSYCRKCGTQVEENTGYCRKCGTPVSGISEAQKFAKDCAAGVNALDTPMKAVGGGALIGLIAFFLPAAGSFGGTISLAGLANEGLAWLWLLPVSYLAVTAGLYWSYSQPNSTKMLLLMGLNTVGTLWLTCALMANKLLGSFGIFASSGIGLLLTILALGTLIVGSYLAILNVQRITISVER